MFVLPLKKGSRNFDPFIRLVVPFGSTGGGVEEGEGRKCLIKEKNFLLLQKSSTITSLLSLDGTRHARGGARQFAEALN